ncbi:MAG TPA: DUF1178 family protein [Albitalea sp.]|nr:DUF1178 family protein [Albitalea sp.]
MKVLDLCCPNGHRFEGWFASDEDFRSQSASGLIECPLCADTSITRLPSAPRLNVSGAREPQAPQSPQTTAEAGAPTVEMTMQAAWLRAVQHVMNNTVDVGERFAQEARRIHYGEVDEYAIRGRATRDEAEALRDEGIEIMALPVPPALKGPLQ